MKLGEAVTIKKKDFINIVGEETYQLSGIQYYGKGVIIRETKHGHELTKGKYQRLKLNHLMWCEKDTTNGAFGVTKPVHVGALATDNYALAEIKTDIIYPDFLEMLFRLPIFSDKISHLSLRINKTKKYYTKSTPRISRASQSEFEKTERAL